MLLVSQSNRLAHCPGNSRSLDLTSGGRVLHRSLIHVLRVLSRGLLHRITTTTLTTPRARLSTSRQCPNLVQNGHICVLHLWRHQEHST